ncbi:MAG: undecaprenyldiphospho-muramoylpentapeptide beta-N-acetylglucosaminyltransferase [Rikenellaceae bacterium]|nr:undecaprenyldiphospho-muramoylpentapeptide beta-N-acetylglucosaminyltransferase [Rikenellaceae bacterium]
MKQDKTYKVILSGGGTGGHIYPAVAVAEALERRLGERVELLFVGALGRMEMEKVPALGYRIEGLAVAGLQRRLTLSNLALPFKVAGSIRRAGKIIRGFSADMVVGFGGYASGPVLWSAQRMGIPTLIQEQNSHAGLTNKLLAKKARHICVAYQGMHRYFPAERIVHTGNPLRGTFTAGGLSKEEAAARVGLDPTRPVILVTGGSLGTRTLNEMMKRNIERFAGPGAPQAIWQTGKYYRAETREFMVGKDGSNIWQGAFIDRMDYAYAAADVVISRSGACTVSELCLAAKPVVFVPSPNVAEDHQTKNARALSDRGAALVVPDARAVEEGVDTALHLASDPKEMKRLSEAIYALAIPDSADRIAELIVRTLEEETKKGK